MLKEVSSEVEQLQAEQMRMEQQASIQPALPLEALQLSWGSAL